MVSRKIMARERTITITDNNKDIMIRKGYSLLKVAFVVVLLLSFDVAAISLCFLISYYTRAWLFVKVFHLLRPMLHSFDVYMDMWPIVFFWPLMFLYEGLYPPIGVSFWEEMKGLIKGDTIAFIVVIILTFITRTSIHFSRPVIFMAFVLSLIVVPLLRRVARSFLRGIGLWSKGVVLVGTNPAIDQVMCNLRKHPDWGLNPAGVIVPAGGAAPEGLEILGTIERMEEMRLSSDEVIVAMPELSRERLAEIVEKSASLAPVVKVVPDLYGLASAGVQTHDLDGMLLLEMEDRLARTRNRVVKRAFDITVSLVSLVLLLPIFLLVAAIIKLDSRGPVFFGHKRIGKGGKPFKCYKFRTMVSNAQEVLEQLLTSDPEARLQWEKDFKLKNDPRITKIGMFLRKTSLDELPQLWNVLKGEMSLVGPRPIISEEVEKYGVKSRYFFKVTPGITGLWQVSGRNDIDYDERVMLDEYYAKNWSLWLDIEIIIRTFGAVLRRQGAY